LASLVRDVIQHVRNPEEPRKSIADSWDHRAYPLGSGSDYTVFLDHLGIPSVDMRFSPRGGQGSNSGVQYGVYHSIYDSFAWMSTFGDPSFAYHETMAKIWGIMALRLADARGALPMDHVTQSIAVAGYVEVVKPMISSSKAFKVLREASRSYVRAALDLARRVRRVFPGRPLAIDAPLNDRLGLAERLFLAPAGLPKRKWFRHVLQAPGLYLGYAADVLPGIVQSARDENNATQANEQALVAAEHITSVARFISPKTPSEVETDEEEEIVLVGSHGDMLAVVAS